MSLSATFRFSIATLAVAVAAGGHAGAARAQNVPPDAAALAGWHGELKWSFHSKEDTSIPPGTSRGETKFGGQAEMRIMQVRPRVLRGTLIGSQTLDTFWWGYPHGGGGGQVCRGSAPPSPVFARVEGSSPSGANPLSLQLADVDAKIDVEWSGGVGCTGSQPIDNATTIAGLVRSLKPVGDGTYKSGFDAIHGLMEAHWSMVLRPGYCGHSLEKGAVFAQSPGHGSVMIYSEPSSNSSHLVSVPNGARLIYNQTKQVNEATWFHVSPPGKPAGWVSSRDLACRRPGEPPPVYLPFDNSPGGNCPGCAGGGRG
jgi:hypothetical protein